MILKEHLKAGVHRVHRGARSGYLQRRTRGPSGSPTALRSDLATLAAGKGLQIASAGTHPFSHWMDQLITIDDRYATIVKDMQQIARALPHLRVCTCTSGYQTGKKELMS